MTFLKNCWYVAAWDFEVPASGFFARTIAGTPLLLWRDCAGTIVAFVDRCCHRGAPLSMGRREGDAIRCGYHGLKFDRAGVCVDIPGQERIPETARIRTIPAIERDRWIWVWLGDPSLADQEAIPDTHWLRHPEWRYKPDYMHYAVNYLMIADNLLDFSHLPFLHGDTLGGSDDFARAPVKYAPLDNGVRVTRYVRGVEPPPYLAKVSSQASKVDRWNIYDFILPSVLLMDSGSAPEGTDFENGERKGSFAFRGCQALTPETENSTHYFFAHCHNFSIDDPAVTESIHQSILKAFHEDKAMIEAQHRSLTLAGDFQPMAIQADAAVYRFRKVLQQKLSQEAVSS